MRRLRIFLWHVHGGYLYYLTKNQHHDFYVPFHESRSADYTGKWGHIPWPDNLHEVHMDEVKNLELDCIIFQLPKQYLEDQYRILSPAQRRLPRIYLEHDPPQGHPTDTRHWVDDPEMLAVHVTPFNQLMWNTGRTPSVFIDHGVTIPEGIRYRGNISRGIVVINNIKTRGRRLGYDIYESIQNDVPLDLIGMGAEDAPGGLGEVLHNRLPAFESQYRFFFNPIRYTSLGLAVCEAMMIGLPVIGLATTEMATAIQNGVSGYVDTNPENLKVYMQQLLQDPKEAAHLGNGARKYAMKRFNIQRFITDWNKAFALVTGTRDAALPQPGEFPESKKEE